MEQAIDRVQDALTATGLRQAARRDLWADDSGLVALPGLQAPGARQRLSDDRGSSRRLARPWTARPPARCAEVVQRVLGTTFGMMLGKVPAIFLGDRVAQTVSMRLVHGIAPAVFAVPGVLALPNVGTLF